MSNLPTIWAPRNGSEVGPAENWVCRDDTSGPVKASTIDELHSLQKKRSAPPSPKVSNGPTVQAFHDQAQLESISASLASFSRETGPKVVKGDPSRVKAPEAPTPKVAAPTQPNISDSALKVTHVLYNLSPAELYEQAIRYEKGSYITSTGALATLSGAKTGRSPKDKRVVKEETSGADLWWGKGSPNIEMDEETFLINRERAVDYLNSLDKVFVNDQFLNWDTAHRLKVRIVSARAYHSLFMHNMCIRPTPEELQTFGKPDFTIYNAGQFPCNRFTHYMTSSTSVDLNLKRREMVILGTQYAGEMKKGLFCVMHYFMPKRGVLTLHSGCNMGKRGDVALFFGLSGTGKTTLSTDHNRLLIGDDEHCWTDQGVSNIEGGCYAKCIDLSQEKEPDIFNAIKFGSVLENVVFDEHTREVDYRDKSVTENTRASYPIEFIPNAKIPCIGPHPQNVILLACDAFGVLPPVSKLTLPQTMYHFISGYTALVAGTEDGIKEPKATFSACFGAAFIMWHPTKYAEMLAQKMEEHGATAWLVNTGWSGGSYGVGSRMKLSYTRKIIDAIHDGSLLSAKYTPTPIFSLQVPDRVEGVPSEILAPENMWADKATYANTLRKLAELFIDNFKKFADHSVGNGTLTKQILDAGPML
jgi:phosphoenolpyruvate carboxykinase (ATP)